MTALFLVISNPRPERPSEQAARRQSFWPWIGKYQADGVCKHIYARVGRGAVATFAVDSNEQLHRILNEWADIIPAESYHPKRRSDCYLDGCVVGSANGVYEVI